MKDDIEKIIADGVYAPSGENCQPWRFSVRDTVIRVYNVPEADQSLYNSRQKGSYVAHGALVENMVISASQHGYSVQVELFPLKDEPDLVSVLTFAKTVPKDEALYPFIENRCTNRREYTGQKLSEDQKRSLAAAAHEGGFAALAFVDDDAALTTLGQALAVNERVLFENKQLHDFFYDHLIWKDEDQGKAGGFYFKTLEFLPHQLKGIKVFKYWPVLALLNKVVGVSKMIVKENGEKYARSGTLAAVVVRGNTNHDFVNAGRAVQRVWLTATRLGLAVHPCTGVLYFTQQINDSGGTVFSGEHRALIQEAYAGIVSAFGVHDETIPMLFRIGYADAPTARSLRMKPVVAYEH